MAYGNGGLGFLLWRQRATLAIQESCHAFVSQETRHRRSSCACNRRDAGSDLKFCRCASVRVPRWWFPPWRMGASRVRLRPGLGSRSRVWRARDGTLLVQQPGRPVWRRLLYSAPYRRAHLLGPPNLPAGASLLLTRVTFGPTVGRPTPRLARQRGVRLSSPAGLRSRVTSVHLPREIIISAWHALDHCSSGNRGTLYSTWHWVVVGMTPTNKTEANFHEVLSRSVFRPALRGRHRTRSCANVRLRNRHGHIWRFKHAVLGHSNQSGAHDVKRIRHERQL